MPVLLNSAMGQSASAELRRNLEQEEHFYTQFLLAQIINSISFHALSTPLQSIDVILEFCPPQASQASAELRQNLGQEENLCTPFPVLTPVDFVAFRVLRWFQIVLKVLLLIPPTCRQAKRARSCGGIWSRRKTSAPSSWCLWTPRSARCSSPGAMSLPGLGCPMRSP